MISCSKSEVRRCRPLLGTFVEITAQGGTGEQTQSAIEPAFAAVECVHRLMSFHDADSDVSRLNRAAPSRPVEVHPWTYEVLAAAQQLHKISWGAFDITIVPQLQKWGYLPKTDDCTPTVVGQEAIELLPDFQVRFHRPVQIDLGGIAKGFAVDKAVEALQAAGVDGGLVNAGGDLRVFGLLAPLIHVRHPASPGRLLPLLKLSNAAVATSGNYFARKKIRGRWVGPLVDPASHQACTGGVSVSVQAPTCLWADALTKVVMLRREESADVLREHGAEAFIITRAGRIVSPSSTDAR